MSTPTPPAHILVARPASSETAAAARSADTHAVDPYTADGTVREVREALCDGLTLSEAVEDWRDRLDAWNRRGQTVMLWGAPDRAAVFVALVDAGIPIDAVITSEPGFLAPSGVPLRTVQRIVEDPPDVVVTVGPDEVSDVRNVLEGHGIGARVYALD